METMTFFELAKLLITFAVCAPSGHNSQPWKFLVENDIIIIEPDWSKRLAVVDESNRELFISLGCAVGNIQVAAAHYGYSTQYDYRDGRIVVSLTKTDINADELLFDAITQRHTHRGKFNGEKVADDKLQQIDSKENILIFDSNSKESEVIRRCIAEGNVVQMSDTAFKNELSSWMRFNKRHVRETKNGLCYNVLGFPATPKFIGRRIVKMCLKPDSQNKTDDGVNASSSHFCVFSTDGNTEKEWIDLGVSLEYFLLKITSMGIAYNFCNQPCEIEPIADNLKRELNIKGWPSIIIRIGYGDAPKHFAPREDVRL